MSKNSKLVYSTDPNTKICPECGKRTCVCSNQKTTQQNDVKISLDRKGRKGKSVTVIEGLAVNPTHLADIAKKLKQALGTGGTAKQGRIEIQGDFRKKVAEKLTDMGYKFKFKGG